MPLTGSLFLQDSQSSCSLGFLLLCPGMAQVVQSLGCACVTAEQQRAKGSRMGREGELWAQPQPQSQCLPSVKPFLCFPRVGRHSHPCIAGADAHRSSLGVTDGCVFVGSHQNARLPSDGCVFVGSHHNARFPSGKRGKERVQVLVFFCHSKGVAIPAISRRLVTVFYYFSNVSHSSLKNSRIITNSCSQHQPFYYQASK